MVWVRFPWLLFFAVRSFLYGLQSGRGSAFVSPDATSILQFQINSNLLLGHTCNSPQAILVPVWPGPDVVQVEFQIVSDKFGFAWRVFPGGLEHNGERRVWACLGVRSDRCGEFLGGLTPVVQHQVWYKAGTTGGHNSHTAEQVLRSMYLRVSWFRIGIAGLR